MNIHDLNEGDTVTAPPLCCDTDMTSYTGPDNVVWDCQYGDSQIYTDLTGQITEPPLIRC